MWDIKISERKAGMLLLNAIFLCLSSIIFTTATAQMRNDNIIESDYRLSEKVVPLHYDIQLIFPTYDSPRIIISSCNIKIQILQPTSNINLHSLHLIIREMTSLHDEVRYGNVIYDRVRYIPDKHTYNSETHILNLHFNETIPAGFYVLYLKYSIPERYINKETAHLNVSFLMKEEENELQEKLFVATKFQSIEARQVFPCWDEPRFRTTFSIAVNHRNKYTVLSNVPLMKAINWRIAEKSWQWTEFEITSPISTHQITFMITNAMKRPKEKKLSHVWSRPNVVKHTQFAKYVINQILAHFWHSNIPIYFTELYHIAIPSIQHHVIEKFDFIIYKEIFFIFDKEIDPIEHKTEVTHTIIHGMVHQWLNYKSCLFWWSELWFIEALQIFFRWRLFDKNFQNWQSMHLFVVHVHHECLHMDTDFHMMPLMNEVRLPSEIKAVFSIALYIKSPVLFRMLYHLIDNFEKIINKYLNACQDQPTSLDYMWNMMENYLYRPKAYHLNYTVKDIMETWAKQSNYPIVEVVRLKKNIIVIKPYHYYLNGYNVTHSVYNACIPITFTTRKQIDFSNTRPQDWLIPGYHEHIKLHLNERFWIIVNLQQTGYYRVKYDSASLDIIATYLLSENYMDIHVLNRAQIIDDACHFWMAKQIKYVKFRRVIEYLRQEIDYVAWYPMFQFFKSISRFLPFEKSKDLKLDMQNILNGLLFNNLGYNETSNENDFIKSLRKEAAWWACTFDHSQSQQIANSILKKHLINPEKNKLMPDWKKWAYCKGLMTANKETLLRTKDYLLSTNTSVDKIYEYLMCSKNFTIADNIVLKYYAIAITDDKLNNTYIPYELITRHARDYIDYIAENFEIYNTIVRNETKLLTIIIYHLYSKIQLEKIIVFVKEAVKSNKITVDTENIEYITDRRLHYIKSHEHTLTELMHF